MFDFRLKVFYTVAKTRNFTQAAKELYISQPAVTKHIKEIESYYQARLINRNAFPNMLTEAGTLLFAYAEKIFSVYRDLDLDMHALNRHFQYSLRVGAPAVASQHMLPALMSAYPKKAKELQWELYSDGVAAIEARLLDRSLDLGVVDRPSGHPEIDCMAVIGDPVVLVCRKGNPLAKEGGLMPADLKKLSFLFPEGRSLIRDLLDDHLKELGMDFTDLRGYMDLSKNDNLKRYLLYSDCFAFATLHSLWKEIRDAELQVVAVEGLEMRRDFWLIRRKDEDSPLVSAFARFAKEQNLIVCP